MKTVKIATIALASLAFAATGCNKGLSDDQQGPRSRDITIGVTGPGYTGAKANASKTATRAAVDKWDNTPVSIAYLFSGESAYTRSLTIPITDVPLTEHDGMQHIKTGMEYPLDGSPVSFVGFHPVAALSATGTVQYDISGGDVDVMMTNSVKGSYNDPICPPGTAGTRPLNFEHLLTRITFNLRCALGQSYPEPIFGINISQATAAPRPLMSVATLDLAATTPTAVPSTAVAFSVPRSIFCGDLAGFPVPLDNEPVRTLDVMLQPGVPLAFQVITLTDKKEITGIVDPNGYWAALTTPGPGVLNATGGGNAGQQYIVNLTFSGEAILAQGITLVAWQPGSTQNLGGNSGTTWW